MSRKKRYVTLEWYPWAVQWTEVQRTYLVDMFVRLYEIDAELAQWRHRRIAERHRVLRRRRVHPRQLVALDVHRVRVGGDGRDVGGHYAPIDMGAMACLLPQLTCKQ